MSTTRIKILSAASELFLEGGAHALSVRAISSKAGMSTIGIYSHFKGKQGILDALYIEGFELVYKAMDVVSDDLVTKQQLLDSALGYLCVGEQHEAHYRLIFGEGDQGYQPSEAAIVARDRAFGKLVTVAGGYLKHKDSSQSKRQLALDIWAISHGYVSISHHTQMIDSGDWKAMALKVVALRIDAVR